MPHDGSTMAQIIKRYANRKLYDSKDATSSATGCL